MYQKTTHGICVSVIPLFLSEVSRAEEDHYTWAYHIQIDNKSEQTVRLKKRFWQVFDMVGHTKEISGKGVVGEEPELHPGDSYEYASGATLTVPSGIMQGCYEMETAEGDCIKVDIPPFSLDSPDHPVVCN